MIVIAPGVASGTTNGPSGHGSRIEKYGPTVWEGVIGGTSRSAPLLEDGRVAAAQHDVPVVAEGPLGLGQLDVEVGDQPLPGLLVGHRVEDRVELQQRVAREVHLGDQPLGERAAEQREVDVCRAPGVVVVPPRIGAGRDGDEPVPAARVGDGAPDPVEVRVEGRGVVLARVPVAPARVRLPDLDERVRYRPPVRVEHLAGHDDPLSLRLAVVLRGQVGIGSRDQAVAEQRPGHLGEPVRQQDQRLLRVAQRGRAVTLEVKRRMQARRRTLVRRQNQPTVLRGQGRRYVSGGHYWWLLACVPWKRRSASSSAGVGAAMISGSAAMARSQPVRSLAAEADTPGYRPVRVNSSVSGSGSRTPRSVMIFLGPAPVSPSRSRSVRPDPYPTEVTKSTRSTNERWFCLTTTITSRHEAAISGAPPAPGSRTLGLP